MELFDKIAEAANKVVDKAENFIKENELDKKASQIIDDIGDGLSDVGSEIKEAFTDKSDDADNNAPSDNKTE